VWYSWRAPNSGSTTIDTCQANIDSILGVYTGTELNNLSRVADNNDYCGGGWGSKVTFNASAGTPTVSWCATLGVLGRAPSP
jgi:hypothetical protein